METLKRIIMTLIFLPILIYTLINNQMNALYFALLIAIIGFLGYFELRRLFLKKKRSHSFMVPLSLFCIYCFLYLKNYDAVMGVFLILFLWESVGHMLHEKNFEKAFFDILVALFIPFYLGLLWGSSILLRQYNPAGFFDAGANTLYLGVFHYIILVCGTWMCDIGAYFIGKMFGKHKINFAVSPNKSVEGFAGGVIFSLIAIGIACYYTSIPFSFWMIFIPFATIVGDLFESLIKRMVGEKDSGKLVPGHGGILDTFDALIFTTPLYYFFIIALVK